MSENIELQKQVTGHGQTIIAPETEIIIPAFSYFRAPISNIKPYKAISLMDAYMVIRGHYFRKRTAELRSLTDPKEIRTFKALNFDYCTFSGVFTRRSDSCLIKHSEWLTFDFDHVEEVRELKQMLLNDPYFQTELLFFSPSGTGLKWIIKIDLNKCSHLVWFLSVAAYIKDVYGLEVDKSGKDVSRACFLPHDPEVYINPVYLSAG